MSEPEKGVELVVEIGCEELPAGWIDSVMESFKERWEKELEASGIGITPVHCFATPRRLVAHAERVLERQEDRIETTFGPPERVGRNAEGWTQAALGFARRLGLEGAEAEAALEIVETARGPYVGARVETLGRPAAEVVPDVLERVLRTTEFPTAMHWDAKINGEPFSFGRPIRWIVALLGGEVIPFRIEVEGGEPVVGDKWSRGHRFCSKVGDPGARFEVTSFDSLNEGLNDRYVALKPDDRKEKLRRAFERASQRGEAPAGLYVVDLPESLAVRGNHHHLVEWPGVVIGRYPKEFLALPEEVRTAVLVHHQKYLPYKEHNVFFAVANMPDDPDSVIRRGAERVVRARMRDAAFFWDEALSRPLDKRREDLARVTFHGNIGDLREHSERVARLAGWIGKRVDADVVVAERAASLAKCDLVTGLVGEFPSLQGIAGGRILGGQGESESVSKAVLEHYRPSGVFGELPETIEGAVVALADRTSTLVGLFAAGEEPSGSGDPFGLRRAALGMLAILRDAPGKFGKRSDGGRESGWPTPEELLRQAFSEAAYDDLSSEGRESKWNALLNFVTDRLRHALAPDGTAPDSTRAVLATRGVGHSVADCWDRIQALERVLSTKNYTALAAAHKRARRILPEEMRSGERPEVNPKLLAESAETALFEGLSSVGRTVAELSGRADYFEAFLELANLAPRVDAFFDAVLVMAEDADVRANRLALLSQLDALFSEVGDLGQIGAGADDITPKQ